MNSRTYPSRWPGRSPSPRCTTPARTSGHLALDPMAEAITHFLLDHGVFVQTYSHGVVKVGQTDMLTYARIWVKSYFGYES